MEVSIDAMYMLLAMLNTHIGLNRRIDTLLKKKIDIVMGIYQKKELEITKKYMDCMANIIKTTIKSMNEEEYNAFMNNTLPFLLEVEEERLENDGNEGQYLNDCNMLRDMHKICEYYKVCL